MIVAHRNKFFHLRRAAFWAACAFGPWAAWLLVGGEIAALGRGWAGAALLSPIAAYLGLGEMSKAIKRQQSIVSIEQGRIVSDKFDYLLQDLLKLEKEERRPRFGMWPEVFIVFNFSGSKSFSILGKSIAEDFDSVKESISLASMSDPANRSPSGAL